MNEERKLAREKEIQLGQLCEEWMTKVGEPFLRDEKENILNELAKAMPNDLVAVQARYKELLQLMTRITNTVNDKKRAVREMRAENRRG